MALFVLRFILCKLPSLGQKALFDGVGNGLL